MPKFPRLTVLAFSALFMLIVTAVACSGDAEPTATVVAIGDFSTCEGFIEPQTVEELSGSTGLIKRISILDIAAVAGLAESGAVNNCLIEVFRTVDGNDDPAPGDSLSLSIVNFETPELALSLYDSTLAAVLLTGEQVGDLAEIEQEVLGADSYLMDVKVGGIGAIVVYVSDTRFVSMSSTANDDGDALLDGQDLVTAAQTVQSRMP